MCTEDLAILAVSNEVANNDDDDVPLGGSGGLGGGGGGGVDVQQPEGVIETDVMEEPHVQDDSSVEVGRAAATSRPGAGGEVEEVDEEVAQRAEAAATHARHAEAAATHASMDEVNEMGEGGGEDEEDEEEDVEDDEEDDEEDGEEEVFEVDDDDDDDEEEEEARAQPQRSKRAVFVNPKLTMGDVVEEKTVTRKSGTKGTVLLTRVEGNKEFTTFRWENVGAGEPIGERPEAEELQTHGHGALIKLQIVDAPLPMALRSGLGAVAYLHGTSLNTDDLIISRANVPLTHMITDWGTCASNTFVKEMGGTSSFVYPALYTKALGLVDDEMDGGLQPRTSCVLRLGQTFFNYLPDRSQDEPCIPSSGVTEGYVFLGLAEPCQFSTVTASDASDEIDPTVAKLVCVKFKVTTEGTPKRPVLKFMAPHGKSFETDPTKVQLACVPLCGSHIVTVDDSGHYGKAFEVQIAKLLQCMPFFAPHRKHDLIPCSEGLHGPAWDTEGVARQLSMPLTGAWSDAELVALIRANRAVVANGTVEMFSSMFKGASSASVSYKKDIETQLATRMQTNLDFLNRHLTFLLAFRAGEPLDKQVAAQLKKLFATAHESNGELIQHANSLLSLPPTGGMGQHTAPGAAAGLAPPKASGGRSRKGPLGLGKPSPSKDTPPQPANKRERKGGAGLGLFDVMSGGSSASTASPNIPPPTSVLAGMAAIADMNDVGKLRSAKEKAEEELTVKSRELVVQHARAEAATALAARETKRANAAEEALEKLRASQTSSSGDSAVKLAVAEANVTRLERELNISSKRVSAMMLNLMGDKEGAAKLMGDVTATGM